MAERDYNELFRRLRSGDAGAFDYTTCKQTSHTAVHDVKEMHINVCSGRALLSRPGFAAGFCEVLTRLAFAFPT